MCVHIHLPEHNIDVRLAADSCAIPSEQHARKQSSPTDDSWPTHVLSTALIWLPLDKVNCPKLEFPGEPDRRGNARMWQLEILTSLEQSA